MIRAPESQLASDVEVEQSDCGSDYDPLEDEVDIGAGDYHNSPKRLFNTRFGDLGLASSIFQVLGTPTEMSWPVSRLGVL